MASADSSNSPGRLPPPRSRQPEPDSPGGPRSGRPFSFQTSISNPDIPMITSPHNEKLKLIRRLGRQRSRDREGLFVGEGEALLPAAREAGAEPVELLTAAGEGLGGTEVEPALLDRASKLGSGTRAIGVWRERWADQPVPPCVYLHGVSDPGNVGTVIRTAYALVGGSVVLGPDCADPFGSHAVRASMGAVFAEPLLRGAVDSTPEPRAALVAHGGDSINALEGAATLCLG